MSSDFNLPHAIFVHEPYFVVARRDNETLRYLVDAALKGRDPLFHRRFRIVVSTSGDIVSGARESIKSYAHRSSKLSAK
jgi:hypothetical protein